MNRHCWLLVYMLLVICFWSSGNSFGIEIKKFNVRIAQKMDYNNLMMVFSEYDIKDSEQGEDFLYVSSLGDCIDINDSNESVNRCVFVFNDFLFLFVMRPIMRGYFVLVPKSGRKGINNIAKNIEFPIRSVSCLLQGRYADSGIVFWRFLLNTVLGGAGAYDIAENVWNIKKRDEDIGQAFASWGIGYGCYLYLPIIGSTSLRDGVGLIFDYALDPKTYLPIPGIQAFASFNKAGLQLDDYLKLVNSFSDPYMVLKTLWSIQRSVKVNIDK